MGRSCAVDLIFSDAAAEAVGLAIEERFEEAS
jgi:hypothetical protein